jgi:hypothetical protein
MDSKAAIIFSFLMIIGFQQKRESLSTKSIRKNSLVFLTVSKYCIIQNHQETKINIDIQNDCENIDWL